MDTWTAHGNNPEAFDKNAALNELKTCPSSNLFTAILNKEPVGILQLDTESTDAGYITFMYLLPEFRNRRLGIQLIGQAVSTCRTLGYQYVRFNCPFECNRIHNFLYKYGFNNIGQTADNSEIFKKYIGY